MPSLFDPLLQGTIPSDPDTAMLRARLRMLQGGTGATPASPLTKTTQGVLSSVPGLPAAFGNAPSGGGYAQYPGYSPAPPSIRAPDPIRPESMFDLGTAIQNIAAQGKKATDDKQKSLAQKIAELALNRITERSNDSNTTGGSQGTFGLSTVGGTGTSKPARRYLTPMEGPDTGEEVADMPGVPKGYFARVSGPESSGRLDAINPTSKAVGKYQFLPTTLRDLKNTNPDLVIDKNWSKDENQQDAWMRAYTQRSIDALKPIIGDRTPTHGELYAMHFFGQKGGAQLLQNKEKKLGDLLPDAVFKWNPRLDKNQTAGDFVDSIDRSWGAQ